MAWATFAIKKLAIDGAIDIKPSGNSMKGKIKSGQTVSIETISQDQLKVGDIVLCKVKGRQYLHLIKSIDNRGRFLIGNNKGKINGWTKCIYGIATHINGKKIKSRSISKKK